METTREEILASSESSADSTTPEMVPPKTTLKKAKITAAKNRAKEILGSGYDDGSSEDEEDFERKS